MAKLTQSATTTQVAWDPIDINSLRDCRDELNKTIDDLNQKLSAGTPLTTGYQEPCSNLSTAALAVWVAANTKNP